MKHTIVYISCMICAILLVKIPETQSQQEKLPVPQLTKKIEIHRGLTEIERECISCHATHEPGKVRDWAKGMHARSTVTCLDCHRAELTDKDARDCPGTEKYRDIKISPIVTPQDCSKCHPYEEMVVQSK